MASPFQLFRRRQKVLLAFFGVAIMVVFVISGALPNLGGGGGKGPKNDVVVTTEYGPLRESELHNLVMQRRAVEQVLQTIVNASITTLVKNQQIDPRREQAAFDSMMAQLRQEILQRFHQTEEEAAVETLVLAKKAEQMGVVVSDAAINGLFHEITRNSDGSQILTSQQLGDILTSARPDGQRISQGRMFELFRQEMLAAKLSRMFQASMNGLTPGQRWDYFEQLNRQATAQVLGVKVANYISQVDDPSDQEIKEYYDKYAAVLPSPSSPEPGFKQPVKARFQYFEADYDRLVKEAKEKVTEEEIQKYYDEHKNTEFRTLDLPPEKKKSADDADAAGDEAQDAKDAAEKKPDGDDKPVADDGEKDTDKPADTDAKSENNPAETKGDAGQQPLKKDDDTKSETKKDALKKSASPVASRSPFRLVSALADDTAETAKADDKQAAAAAPETPADETAAEKKADGAKADGAKADGEKAAGEKAAGEKAADKSNDEKSAAEGDTPKFDPIEKVRDTIVNRLASDKAREATQTAFDNIEAAMQEYANQFVLYSAKKESDPNAIPPAQLDLGKLATDNNVTAHDTELISQLDADSTKLGKSYNIERDPRSPIGFRQITFESFAFSDRLPLLRPSRTFDDAQNTFLFWKTEQVAEHTPALESIKSQVVRAWKMNKARQLALKKAQEYADQVKAAKSTIKDVLGKESGLTVTETGPFSWLTMGSAAPFEASGGMPRISDVPGVDYPGPAFMQTLFDLESNQVGTALNQPETTAYVVQLIEYLRPIQQLEEQFAGESFRKYAAAAVPEQRKIYTEWLADVEKAARVKWERQPRPNREAM